MFKSTFNTIMESNNFDRSKHLQIFREVLKCHIDGKNSNNSDINKSTF